MLGADGTSHISTIAHTTIGEWEAMIASPDIMGQVLTPVLRSKLRQVLLCARIIVGVIKQPTPPPEPKPVVVEVNRTASSEDDSLMVCLNDVAKQGSEVKVPRMSDDDYQAALRVYRAQKATCPPMQKRRRLNKQARS